MFIAKALSYFYGINARATIPRVAGGVIAPSSDNLGKLVSEPSKKITVFSYINNNLFHSVVLAPPPHRFSSKPRWSHSIPVKSHVFTFLREKRLLVCVVYIYYFFNSPKIERMKVNNFFRIIKPTYL